MLIHPNRCLPALLILLLGAGCNGQANGNLGKEAASATPQGSSRVGGNCDTCELMYIGIPESINATDTSAAWKEPGQKLLISGTVYMPDGMTPASGVILYYWQTNSEGVYKTSDELDQKVEPHGHIRGWIKTGEEGEFNIYTTRPGPYPGRKDPQHIHILVKEPDLPNEYYIDDILFEGDPRLTSDWRRNLENRGGSGIVQTKLENGVQVAERNIILGLNIPDYPTLK